jgi:hypothetical protein
MHSNAHIKACVRQHDDAIHTSASQGAAEPSRYAFGFACGGCFSWRGAGWHRSSR